MIQIIMHGCCGYMGQVVTRMVQEDPEVQIIAGIDPVGGSETGYPIFKNLREMEENGIGQNAVIIDFSTAAAVDDLLDYCGKNAVPVVLCTTGLNEVQMKNLKKTAEKTAIVKSANMSLGINLLIKLLKEAAEVLNPAGFDAEIVERHHRRKLDAPSGTAIALADAVREGIGEDYSINLNRSDDRKPRAKEEIGVVAVRGGNIVGDHNVIFAGEDEVIELRHTAYSRNIFAKGAITAAKFLAGKNPGLYDMSDVIG